MQNAHLPDGSPQQLLDELRNRFAATRPTGAPALEEVLLSVSEPHRPELFRQLLTVEIEHHARAQQPLSLPEALGRFQSLGPWTESIIRELLTQTESWGATRSGTPVATRGNREYVGQYELLAKLGSGGYGAVYKARHTQLKSLVALKVLIPHRVLTPGGIERFFREMEILGRLSHPHIVRATDAGEARGYYYLAMELVEGFDLGYLVKQLSRLPIPEACEATRQAAEALAFIAGQRMVHRDVKPSNLLLGQDGVVRLLDLGLAQLGDVPPWEQLTETGAIMGTPEYMSPEQTRESRDVDIRSDVYSLGCTLFALLTGSPPFTRSGSIYDLFRAQNETPPPLIRTIREEVPPELEQLILRMLEKSPAQRPMPEEVIQVLLPFCANADLKRLVADCGPRTETPADLPTAHTPLAFNHDPTATQPPPASTVSLRPAIAPRRTRRWALATACAIVLGGVACAVWFTLSDKKPEESSQPPRAPETPAPGPTIPPVPKVLPRSFKPGEWTELLDRPPVKKTWPAKDPRSSFSYDAEHRQLSVNCTDYGVLELGEIAAEAYDVQVKVFQNGWGVGRLGVFVCGRQPPVAAPGFSWQAETLFLQTLDPNGMSATLARGELSVSANTGGRRSVDRVLYGVPRPAIDDHTISFTVGPAGITNVAWDGSPAVLFGSPQPEPKIPSGGSIGVLVNNSAVLFRSVRVRPHSIPGDHP